MTLRKRQRDNNINWGGRVSVTFTGERERKKESERQTDREKQIQTDRDRQT